MFERILLVLDGSKITEQAIPYAALLTKTLGSQMHIVCVQKGSEHRGYLGEKVTEIVAAFGRMNIKTAEVVAGEAASGIINYAVQNEMGLVVMATHSRTGILLWPSGNIATKILEGITMPLLSIKDTGAKVSPDCVLCHRIIVPLDGSKPGEAALPYAVELARQVKADLVLLRVVEPGQAVRTVGGINYVNLLPEQVERLMSEARGYLAEISKSITGIKHLSLDVRQGMPPRDVMKYSEEVKADLVALSTHGASISKGIFGSVFRKILQSGRTHILAVRPLD